MSEWRSISDIADGEDEIVVRVETHFRFKKYKPNSNEAKRGKVGRWQTLNGYGGWDNCELPQGVDYKTYEEHQND